VSLIQPIPLEEIAKLARIVAEAYPMVYDLTVPGALDRLTQRLQYIRDEPATAIYGLYRDAHLLGAMRWFDFEMNVFGTLIPTAGLGMVSVDTSHKKQGVARDMVQFFLQHAYETGKPLAALYPFRPDFYKQMGFGYGTKLHHYTVAPAMLPTSGERRQTRIVGKEQQEEVAACYRRCHQAIHGLFQKRPSEEAALFDAPENRVFAYSDDQGVVRGYGVFQYRKGPHFVAYDLEIRELLYENRAALLSMLAFLQTMHDQIRTIHVYTSDDFFHHLLADPRNGSGNIFPHAYHESHATGVGLMYRILNLPALFRHLAGHNFGGQSCSLKLTLDDDFFAPGQRSTIVEFDEGWSTVLDDDDGSALEIRLGVAECSSLILGVTPFSALYNYGLAEIADESRLHLVDRLFRSPMPPVCVTKF
jgi:predicted acetyltransferase